MSNPPPLLAAAAAILLLGCGSQPTVQSDGEPAIADELDAGRAPASADAGKKDAASPPPKRDASERTPIPVAPQDAGAADADGPRCGDGTREDVDGDGFTRAQGDCNDCLKTTSPAAFDIPGNGVDEDCSGSDDPSTVACDQQLALGSADAKDAARAIDLCQFTEADSPRWGVISARFTDATGKGKLSDPQAVGMLPSFGAAKPRAGKALFALSSGVARAPGQSGFTPGCDTLDSKCRGLFDQCTSGGEPPPGYPQSSSTCSDQFGDDETATLYNQAALELQIRVPSNANALSFESIFYTQEYPHFICSTFNDFFVVFREPAPAHAADGNILFDKNHDPIGVNTGLLSVCDPSAQPRGADKRFECEQGTALLKGTGYGAGESTCLTSDSGGASTGWLKTTAPVMPGELVTLRFAIWDTNDALLDSTALLDHFSWITYEGEPEKEIEIETEPVPFI